jgi:hypothetical protein
VELQRKDPGMALSYREICAKISEPLIKIDWMKRKSGGSPATVNPVDL